MFTIDPAVGPLADAVAPLLAITQAAAAKRIERLAHNYAATHEVELPAAIATLAALGDQALSVLVAEGPHEQVAAITPAHLRHPGTHGGAGGHVLAEELAAEASGYAGGE